MRLQPPQIEGRELLFGHTKFTHLLTQTPKFIQVEIGEREGLQITDRLIDPAFTLRKDRLNIEHRDLVR